MLRTLKRKLDAISRPGTAPTGAKSAEPPPAVAAAAPSAEPPPTVSGEPLPAEPPSAAVTAPTTSVLDQYVRLAPSAQNALDIFTGQWSSKLPESIGLQTTGASPLFEDHRIKWLVDHVGGVAGFKVLELGPLEAGHTYMLHEAGASVLALEANTQAFLKCLVVKEALGLPRCRFRLGDFVPYLKGTSDHFDLLVASGVLYHSSDPIALLASMVRVADRIGIWTHYYDAQVVSAAPEKERMFVPKPERVEWRGHRLAMYRRNYLESLNWPGFCGGPESSALWMERSGLMTVLTELGYGRITIQADELDHPNGPCIMLCAER